MKGFRVSLVILSVLLTGIAVVWLVSTSRAATETPNYTVLRTDGKFEIRDYPELTVATTRMESAEMNGGFGKLFRFITGTNEAAQKIEMTSPVLIDTAKDQKTMSFIMPRKAVEKGVPKPTADNVTVRKLEPATFAVFRFAGGRAAEDEAGAIAQLRGWLAGQKIEGNGEPVFAYYDPPWTPVFLRRNEVMIRVDRPAQ